MKPKRTWVFIADAGRTPILPVMALSVGRQTEGFGSNRPSGRVRHHLVPKGSPYTEADIHGSSAGGDCHVDDRVRFSGNSGRNPGAAKGRV